MLTVVLPRGHKYPHLLLKFFSDMILSQISSVMGLYSGLIISARIVLAADCNHSHTVAS